MMTGNILAFWSSVRERCWASFFTTSLGLRPTVAVSEEGVAGSCNPVSPAKAAELAIKISNENIRFIGFSKSRSATLEWAGKSGEWCRVYSVDIFESQIG